MAFVSIPLKCMLFPYIIGAILLCLIEVYLSLLIVQYKLIVCFFLFFSLLSLSKFSFLRLSIFTFLACTPVILTSFGDRPLPIFFIFFNLLCYCEPIPYFVRKPQKSSSFVRFLSKSKDHWHVFSSIFSNHYLLYLLGNSVTWIWSGSLLT